MRTEYARDSTGELLLDAAGKSYQVEYLDWYDIKEQYGLNYDQVKRLNKKGYISTGYKFIGAQRVYWTRDEVIAAVAKYHAPIQRVPVPSHARKDYLTKAQQQYDAPDQKLPDKDAAGFAGR